MSPFLTRDLWETAFAFYGLSNLSFWGELSSRRKFFTNLALLFAIIGILVHLAAFAILGINSKRFPIFQLHDTLGLISILIVISYIILQWKWSLKGIGFFATALAFFFTLVSIAVPSRFDSFSSPQLKGLTLEIHIGVILLSFGIFAVAFCTSSVYLLQDFMLHTKRVFPLSKRLPPLTTLDSVANHLVGIGFVLLSIGIALGSIWAERWWGTWWSWDPKQDFALMTWLIYALYIHARTLSGWKGKRSMSLIVIGFILVIATLLGASFLPGRHHFV